MPNLNTDEQRRTVADPGLHAGRRAVPRPRRRRCAADAGGICLRVEIAAASPRAQAKLLLLRAGSSYELKSPRRAAAASSQIRLDLAAAAAAAFDLVILLIFISGLQLI